MALQRFSLLLLFTLLFTELKYYFAHINNRIPRGIQLSIEFRGRLISAQCPSEFGPKRKVL